MKAAPGVVDRDGHPFPEGADHGGYLVYSSDRPLKAKLVVKVTVRNPTRTRPATVTRSEVPGNGTLP